MDNEIDRENRRIALDSALDSARATGAYESDEDIVKRAQAYLSFLNGSSS